MKKIVNEYVFDYPMLKKFYQINFQPKFYLVLLSLVLISSVFSFLEKDFSFGIFSLLIFMLGCLYYFFLPFFLAKIFYKKILIQSGDKDIYVKVNMDSKSITVEYRELKKKNVYSLGSIKKIRYSKGIFCLYTKERGTILLADSGFVKGDKQLLYSLLASAKKQKSN